jgi:hypothetical protein
MRPCFKLSMETAPTIGPWSYRTRLPKSIQAAADRAHAEMALAARPSDGGVSVLFVNGWLPVDGQETQLEPGNQVLLNKVRTRIDLDRHFSWEPGKSKNKTTEREVTCFILTITFICGSGLASVMFATSRCGARSRRTSARVVSIKVQVHDMFEVASWCSTLDFQLPSLPNFHSACPNRELLVFPFRRACGR